MISMRALICCLALFFSTQLVFADIRFLSLSDIHYDTENISSDGHDTGETLLNSSLKKVNQLTKDVDFILTLGDFPTHKLVGSPKIATNLQTVFQGLYQADRPAKPMFYITGNNDSLKGNYQPFSWNGKSALTYANHWKNMCIHCKGLMIDGQHIQDQGYYSSYVLPQNKDIVLIALNTVQFAKIPTLLPGYPNQNTDATQQLKWLETQLKTLHAKQLLIAMHIPPGIDYKGNPIWQEDYLTQFIHLLNTTHQNYDQITLLTAHTHMDDIRKIQLNNDLTVYAYATPSISQNHHNNPAMKIFELDNDLHMKDYTTYYTTDDDQWRNEHYQAIETIYPQCVGKTLTSCLDSLTNELVCQPLQKKAFYGAKSPRVDGSVCKKTYSIN
jgi:UDP-2,3-diacylglucosamine pyrophosphatase LpxH